MGMAKIPQRRNGQKLYAIEKRKEKKKRKKKKKNDDNKQR